MPKRDKPHFRIRHKETGRYRGTRTSYAAIVSSISWEPTGTKFRSLKGAIRIFEWVLEDFIHELDIRSGDDPRPEDEFLFYNEDMMDFIDNAEIVSMPGDEVVEGLIDIETHILDKYDPPKKCKDCSRVDEEPGNDICSFCDWETHHAWTPKKEVND